jgi:hypothetical protein
VQLHATSTMSCAILQARNVVKTKNLYDSYSKENYYQNSEYEVHQVEPNYFGSQNFSFLASKGEAVGSIQISSYDGACQTKKIFWAHIMFFHVFKKSKT